MVHSTFAQGHIMGGRGDSSPLGIPKSPSFHSGLDLVASASVESLVSAQTSSYIESIGDKLDYNFDKYILGTEKDASKDVENENENLKCESKYTTNLVKSSPSHLNLPLQKNANAVRTLQSTGYLPQLTGDWLKQKQYLQL